ncbi:glutamate--tRNA ligase [Candidatus Nanosynbacter featherlites]|uniref:Glutamate--tRNA ligase n=1 Tax=Candidatus Nanosynbacter featherlites TaxID=2572088 RepID=A0A4P9A2W3_9BACT|nr:glutamate--tRNA ligase [Candidatus Nanosynbacter featherlites]QCT42099.1 glutamate--tRNA ligase [Candidatus Nanosynbacter featherlites]
MTIRTRFAPSPTGYIHVGNVRAALFPWLLTRQQGGSFILRIEDTDRSRFVPGAEDLILDTLEWLGIDWDEGPRKGGSHGPYHQSERLEIYHTWAKKLVEKGLAYADPYTPEEVQGFREEARALKKAFLYRDYRPENPPEWDGTQPLRFKVTSPKRYTWNDPVMGELSAGPEALDDFILIKADGYPTYNFAHIIDDFEMGITHVIRGLEYISSTPKYLSLYEALEITPPTLVCLPHIMAPDGRKKLGKRDGAKSVTDYRTDGILPEAMLNFLASMGWNDGTEQEIFSRQELIDKFSLDRVQRSGARFDEKRLLWMNGQWIRQISLDDLYQRVESYWPQSAAQFDASYKHQVLALVQDRLKTLAELPMMSRFFFEEPDVNWELITSNKQLKKLSEGEIRELLKTVHDKLAELADWNPETIQETLNQLLEITGQKPGVLFSLIRIVTTWAPFSPQLNDTLALFGKDKTLSRIASQL